MRFSEFILSWGFLFLSALADCLTIYIVKWRTNALGKIEFHSFQEVSSYVVAFLQHPLVWFGGVTFIGGPLLGYVALTRINLTLAYPVSVTLHVLLTFAFGFILLQEPFNTNKLIGILFLLIGLYLIFTK